MARSGASSRIPGGNIGVPLRPHFGVVLLGALLPLLDKLNAEYAKGLAGGVGDEPFWNSMCKRGGTSGSAAAVATASSF